MFLAITHAARSVKQRVFQLLGDEKFNKVGSMNSTEEFNSTLDLNFELRMSLGTMIGN